MLKHDKLWLCFCIPGPLTSLSSQGWRKILGLGIRRPECATAHLSDLAHCAGFQFMCGRKGLHLT